jgi:hypothetical protein
VTHPLQERVDLRAMTVAEEGANRQRVLREHGVAGGYDGSRSVNHATRRFVSHTTPR